MIRNILVAGGGLEFERGQVVGLSDASALRTDVATGLYTGDHDVREPLGDGAIATFAGAYPRLPQGVLDVPYHFREGSLMRDRAITNGVPEDQARAEVNSTSTAKNVVHALRGITHGIKNPDKRDIARFINQGQKLGVVASEGQLPRLLDDLKVVGCDPNAIVLLPTPEAVRFYDKAAYLAHKVGMLAVPQGNVERLLLVDNALERVNDGVHGAVDLAKRAKHRLKRTTPPSRKVVS